METKAGYVTILGFPNVGKSTLLNSIIGQKLSIVSAKPQTTRKRILGILSDENSQIIFLDTPGILEPNYLLQEKLVDFINISVVDADIFILLIDVTEDISSVFTNNVVRKIIKSESPLFIVLNKIDLINQEKLQPIFNQISEMQIRAKIIPISAKKNFGTTELIEQIKLELPIHPKFFPEDPLSDETERFFVSEIIREKIFENYQDEIPYSTEVVIEEFREQENRKDYILASIIIERDSQKPIIIGKNGTAIKKIGELSRKSIEEFLERSVFLELNVKVRTKWRSNPNLLKSLGYDISE